MTEISLLSHAHSNEILGKTIFKPVYRCIVVPKNEPVNKFARFVTPSSDSITQSDGSKVWICKSKSSVQIDLVTNLIANYELNR